MGEVLTAPLDFEQWLARLVRGEEHARLLRALNLRSVLHVPLAGHHGTIGVLSLATSGARRLAPEDVGLAQELARCSSLVLENARLFREREAWHTWR